MAAATVQTLEGVEAPAASAYLQAFWDLATWSVLASELLAQSLEARQ